MLCTCHCVNLFNDNKASFSVELILIPPEGRLICWEKVGNLHSCGYFISLKLTQLMFYIDFALLFLLRQLWTLILSLRRPVGLRLVFSCFSFSMLRFTYARKFNMWCCSCGAALVMLLLWCSLLLIHIHCLFIVHFSFYLSIN